MTPPLSRPPLGRAGLCAAWVLAACGAWPGASAQPADKPLATLLAERQWPEALAALDRALASRPNDTQLLMDRGAVLTNLGRHADALTTFRKVTALKPQLPAAHNNMAVILAAMGRHDEARVALERAIRAQPDYATAHENLGDLYVHLAADAYRNALQADASLKSARAKLELTGALVAPGGSVGPAAASPAAAGAASAASAAADSAAGASPALRPAVAGSGPATTASTQTARAAPADAAGEVEAAVRAWAAAWAQRDVEGYLSAYAPQFQGGAADPAAWRRERAQRLEAASRIAVQISDLRVSVDGERAEATFRQSYDSSVPGSRARTGKTLKMQRVQGRWLIREEIRH